MRNRLQKNEEFEEININPKEKELIKEKNSLLNDYNENKSLHDFIELVERKQEQFKDNPDNFTYCRNVNGYRFEERDFS